MAELSEVGTEAELIAEAEIGEEAKKFLESDLGKTILGMAEQETRLAQEGLREVNPLDTAKIMELQNQAKFGLKFNDWLTELVSKGNDAMTIWVERRRDNG